MTNLPTVIAIVNALWTCEGGSKTAWPYGIKCHHHSPQVARRMAINTVRHIESAYRIWPHGDYISYIADWWCPDDKKGNVNLYANLHKILDGKHFPPPALRVELREPSPITQRCQSTGEILGDGIFKLKGE